MNWRIAIAAMTAASLTIPAGTALAAKKKTRVTPPAYVSDSSMAPARMIEIRPGYFVSSYGCVTDQGYGRILPCSYSGDKD